MVARDYSNQIGLSRFREVGKGAEIVDKVQEKVTLFWRAALGGQLEGVHNIIHAIDSQCIRQ